MLRSRIIPVLLIKGSSLVKTIKFKKYSYIGDPCNTVRIFNELEVDELIICDIRASLNKMVPDFELLSDIASECFMPLAYGGGIKTIEQAKKIFDLGYEKIILNSSIFQNPKILTEFADTYGSQAIICSIDVKKNFFGKRSVFSHSGTVNTNFTPLDWAKKVEKLGAGEILLTSMDRDGTKKGFDLELTKKISSSVEIPVIASGGIGKIDHFVDGVVKGGASALLAASVFHFGEFGISEVKKHLISKGINVRMDY